MLPRDKTSNGHTAESAALSGAAVAPIVRYDRGARVEALDLVAAEESVLIEVEVGSGPPVEMGVTMRTPGADRELAVGMLVAEGIIEQPSDVVDVETGSRSCGSRAASAIVVRLRPGLSLTQQDVGARVLRSAACGVCGARSVDVAADHLAAIEERGLTVPADTLCAMPDVLRQTQLLFGHTGGLHAAALFRPDGRLVRVCEDIGRHNAVDKLIGAALMNGDELRDSVLFLSGRAGFELIYKAAVVHIPVVASIGAPSSLAVDLASRQRITLAGFVRQTGLNVYSMSDRIVGGRDT